MVFYQGLGSRQRYCRSGTNAANSDFNNLPGISSASDGTVSFWLLLHGSGIRILFRDEIAVFISEWEETAGDDPQYSYDFNQA